MIQLLQFSLLFVALRMSGSGSTEWIQMFVKTCLIGLAPLISLYVSVPVLTFVFPHFMQHLFFLTFFKDPTTDYDDLRKYELSGRNFYLTSSIVSKNEEEAPNLGVWHIYSKSFSEEFPNADEFTSDKLKKLIKERDQSFVVYLHGNSIDRSSEHRCELYRLLADLDFHVFVVDYRGYGDSTGHPTEDGVVADAKAIYNYVKELDPTKQIFVWGHSMGTGVALRTVAELPEPPSGLVLEAPFNNLHDAVAHHPYGKPWRLMPFFEQLVVQPLMRSGLRMESDKHIKQISCPMLALHAEDDHIIPVHLGRQLVQIAKQADRNIVYIEFHASLGYLHSYICRGKELRDIVDRFFSGKEDENRELDRQSQRRPL